MKRPGRRECDGAVAGSANLPFAAGLVEEEAFFSAVSDDYALADGGLDPDLVRRARATGPATPAATGRALRPDPPRRERRIRGLVSSLSLPASTSDRPGLSPLAGARLACETRVQAQFAAMDAARSPEGADGPYQEDGDATTCDDCSRARPPPRAAPRGHDELLHCQMTRRPAAKPRHAVTAGGGGRRGSARPAARARSARPARRAVLRGSPPAPPPTRRELRLAADDFDEDNEDDEAKRVRRASPMRDEPSPAARRACSARRRRAADGRRRRRRRRPAAAPAAAPRPRAPAAAPADDAASSVPRCSAATGGEPARRLRLNCTPSIGAETAEAASCAAPPGGRGLQRLSRGSPTSRRSRSTRCSTRLLGATLSQVASWRHAPATSSRRLAGRTYSPPRPPEAEPCAASRRSS